MTQAGKMYGTALYELAAEEKIEDQVLEELAQVAQCVAHEPDFTKLLALPSIPKAERCQTLDNVFGGKIHTYLLNFLKILCEKGEIRALADCAKQYRASYNEAHGILEATATTAVAMSSEQQAALKAKLEKITGKTVSLTCRQDAACVGGVRLDVGGKQLDGTVQNRLNELNGLLKATV